METKIQLCNVCNEETVHDVGKKLAHRGDSHYIRRTTARCRQYGTKEIVNRRTVRRIVKGINTLVKSSASLGGEDD